MNILFAIIAFLAYTLILFLAFYLCCKWASEVDEEDDNLPK